MHFALLLFATSCGEAPKENSSATPAEEPKSMVEDAPTYDPHRGEERMRKRWHCSYSKY